MENEPITIYLTATGEITAIDEIINGVVPTLDAGEAYISGAYDAATQYISGGVAVDRPVVDVDLVDGEQHVIVAGENLIFTLVAGTQVVDASTQDSWTSVGSESLTITGAINDDFPILVFPPWPYQTAEIQVIINAD